MKLREWLSQIDMLKDLRTRFDVACANARKAEQEGANIYLTRQEMWLLCEVCSQRATILNRGDFQYKGYKGENEGIED